MGGRLGDEGAGLVSLSGEGPDWIRLQEQERLSVSVSVCMCTVFSPTHLSKMPPEVTKSQDWSFKIKELQSVCACVCFPLGRSSKLTYMFTLVRLTCGRLYGPASRLQAYHFKRQSEPKLEVT